MCRNAALLSRLLTFASGTLMSRLASAAAAASPAAAMAASAAPLMPLPARLRLHSRLLQPSAAASDARPST
jgi:hypothetical protein